MLGHFRYPSENGFTFEAVVLPNGSSPFSIWVAGLDIPAFAKVISAFDLIAASEAGAPGTGAAGRISHINESLTEFRITKKGMRGGPHLRAIVPREYVSLGETFHLLTGFTKSTDTIGEQEIKKAMRILTRWRCA